MLCSLHRRLLDPRDSPRLMTRRIFGFRRRLFLLAFLCVLWIYHSISKRARNFESDRSSDRTEETLMIFPRDNTSDKSSRPTTTDDDYDPPPSRPVVAVLPVTSSSLSHLSESLAGLSTIPHLNEIYLLCPGNITNAVRSGLRKTLSLTQGFNHTEFFLTLWRDEWSEAESTLRVASNILSNDILILPQDALIGIDSIARDSLFSGPPPLSVPLGLHGSGISCEPGYQGFSTAHFVLPPLLLPSRLGFMNQPYLHLTSWQELGAHFARVTGVGGVIPVKTPEKTSGCRDLGTPEAVASAMEGKELPLSSSEAKDLFVVLVAQAGDVPALSELACKFKYRGTGVQIFAGGTQSDSSTASNPTSDDCGVTFTQVPDLQDPTIYQLLGHPQSVVLTLAEYHFSPVSLFDTWPTAIRIPRRDLPHSDWIATLGVEELRSKHPLRLCRGYSYRRRLACP